MSRAPLLDADAAAFRYVQRPRAVGPFTLRVDAGELHLLCGPSGSGKSTLARMLAGLIPHLYRGALGGCVRVDGRPTAALPLSTLTERVGLIGQNPAAQLLASSVRAEIAFGLHGLPLDRAARDRRLAWALDAFDLAALAERDPRTLSGGEQQRTVLAAIAARRPAALVLDEPLAMLDAAAARTAVAQLDALRNGGTAVVAIEHRAAPFLALRAVRHALAAGDALPSDALPEPPDSVAPLRLAAEGLTVDLGGRRVLDGIDLALRGGEVVSVVGRNGAGKTTLLRALAGLQRHGGRVQSRTAAPGGGAPRMAMVFQNPDRQLFNATVLEELCFANSRATPDRCARVLALLGLSGLERSSPLLLSEGEKRRLGVAIMLMRPDLHGICLDEPTLGQDAAHRRLLGRVLRRLAAAGFLCVAATHDHEWAARWSDRVILLDGGRLVAGEPPRRFVPEAAAPRGSAAG